MPRAKLNSVWNPLPSNTHISNLIFRRAGCIWQLTTFQSWKSNNTPANVMQRFSRPFFACTACCSGMNTFEETLSEYVHSSAFVEFIVSCPCLWQSRLFTLNSRVAIRNRKKPFWPAMCLDKLVCLKHALNHFRKNTYSTFAKSRLRPLSCLYSKCSIKK